jgi:hypothetical protein
MLQVLDLLIEDDDVYQTILEKKTIHFFKVNQQKTLLVMVHRDVV